MKKIAISIFICFSSLLLAQEGLVGEYYNGTNFEQKVLTRIDPKIDFGWWESSPQNGVVNDEYYSIRWTGKLLAPETGKYLFSAKVDDGIRLWVNGTPMINAWGLHNRGDFSNSIVLEKGKSYSIKIEYFNAMREGEITLLWQTPSQVNSSTYSYSNFKPVSGTYLFKPNSSPKLPEPPVIASKAVVSPKESKPNSKKSTPSVLPSGGQSQKDKITTKTTSAFENMDKDLDIKQVFFMKGVNQMTNNSIERLDKVVLFLKNKPSSKIELKGHTDVMGDTEKNMELSISRAKVVTEYLLSKGILESRIHFQGYGGTKPLIANPQSEEERAVNRRVDFIVQ